MSAESTKNWIQTVTETCGSDVLKFSKNLNLSEMFSLFYTLLWFIEVCSIGLCTAL